MSEAYQSLTHSRWNCKYHVVFVPAGGVKPCLGTSAKPSDRSFMSWLVRKQCRIIEGHLMPDHVHMCIEIPPSMLSPR